MRIHCLVNRDLASNVALNLLLPALAPHEVRVGLTDRVGAAAAAEPPGRRALRLAEQTLPNERLWPLLERAGLPDDGARFLAFGEMEARRGIPVRALPSPNAGEGLEALRAFAPDLLLTIRYGAILKADAIAVPRLGVLNLHSGLLPAYRGVLATFRALMNGDAEVGCTLHWIADGTIDTGEILAEARVPVRPERSLLWHVLALYPPGTALIAGALARLAAGERPASLPQSAAGAAYYSWPSAEEWAEFARRGWRVADAADLDEITRRYLPARWEGISP